MSLAGIGRAGSKDMREKWTNGPDTLQHSVLTKCPSLRCQLLAKPFEADFEGSAAEARVHGTRAPCSWAFACSKPRSE